MNLLRKTILLFYRRADYFFSAKVYSLNNEDTFDINGNLKHHYFYSLKGSNVFDGVCKIIESEYPKNKFYYYVQNISRIK